MLLSATEQTYRGIGVSERPASFRALVDDEVAFGVWYADALPRVYAYLYSRCGGDAALAEELTQLAFSEAVRRPDRWGGRSDLVTWVVSIGRHKLVDHFRRQGRDARRLAALAERAERSGDAIAMTATDVDIERALGRLPADQRLALVLRAVDGLPVRDVAAIIGRSEDATESLIRRARAAFRREYGSEADG